MNPHGKKAKELMIGKGEEWRDQTHFKSAVAGSRVDWLIFMPLFAAGVIGMLTGRVWGYAIFGASAAIQLYINVYLFVLEKEYVYPAVGPWAYFTYVWGNFIYWSTLTIIYVVLRLNGITF